ncbi:MAG: hypothetical protein AAGU74_11500 [Bacillota bacterium]
MDNFNQIKEKGLEQFLLEAEKVWTCPDCEKLLTVHRPNACTVSHPILTIKGNQDKLQFAAEPASINVKTKWVSIRRHFTTGMKYEVHIRTSYFIPADSRDCFSTTAPHLLFKAFAAQIEQ